MITGVRFKTAVEGFFDKPAVMRAVDGARRRVLSEVGAYVAQTAKRSIRRAKGTSKPGRPPHSQTGLLRRTIFFSYDIPRSNVVIGPVRLGGRGDAQELLEYGGTAKRKKRGRIVAQFYRARPFMRPAFRTELSKHAKRWRDALKG